MWSLYAYFCCWKYTMLDTEQVCLVKFLVEFLVYHCGFQYTLLLSLSLCMKPLNCRKTQDIHNWHWSLYNINVEFARMLCQNQARIVGKSYLKQWGKEAWEGANILCQKSWAIIRDGWYISAVSAWNVSRKKSRSWIYLSQTVEGLWLVLRLDKNLLVQSVFSWRVFKNWVLKFC